MNTRSRTRQGGAGNQAIPVRNRQDAQPGAEQSEASGTRLRIDTTRQPRIQGSSDETNIVSAISEDVVEGEGAQPIHESNKKRRMKWTDEINDHIIRCYYHITELESSRAPYSEELYRRVTTKFPQIRQKTVQNILDQRRSLMRNNRIPPERLNQIRQDVAIELGLLHEVEHDDGEPVVDVADTVTVEVDDIVEDEALKRFNKCYMEYEGTTISLRPLIPKLRQKRDTNQIIHRVNEIIQSKVSESDSLNKLHFIIYVGAFTVTQLHNQRTTKRKSNKPNTINKKPAWEIRLIAKINGLRKSIGQLTEVLRENCSTRIKKATEKILANNKTEKLTKPEEVRELLIQKLKVQATKLKRYQKSKERKTQNIKFQQNEKAFYRTICAQKANAAGHNNELSFPTKDSIKEFWEGVWSNEVQHKDSKWIRDEKRLVGPLRTMYDWKITPNNLKAALKKTPNWKSPGNDSLHGFWLKKFTATHIQLLRLYNNLLEVPENIPKFMTEGITYLIPKGGATNDPAKYRPITCLPGMYKLLTSILSDKIYEHLDINNLLDEEQKGCRKGSRGCKEQLVIDSIITGNAVKTKKPLFTAFVDYRKAFDSVPHSWLIEVLQLYSIEPHICEFLRVASSKWSTNIRLQSGPQVVDAGHIQIRRGIFQGDSLSPLWFCLALRPLTTLLKQQNKGYRLGEIELSHLLYMDDLKIYASSRKHLNILLDATRKFSTSLDMSFGLDKCRVNALVNGKWVKQNDYAMEDDQTTMVGMEKDELYKYLGFGQSRGIDQSIAKDQLKQKYKERLQLILKTELNGKNKVKAISTYAQSVLSYSYGIIKWTPTDLKNLDITTRTECTKHRVHHPRSAVERFHLPRPKGGRGIPQASTQNSKQIRNLRGYFMEKAKTCSLHKAVVQADTMITPLKLADREFQPLSQNNTLEEIINKWKGKPLHGKYPTQLCAEYIDARATNTWLTRGELYGETEGFLIAIQDQVIPTKYYRRHILQQQIDDRCRICAQKGESIDHVIGGCTILAPKDYTDRHNRVAGIIHQEIVHNYTNNEKLPYYKYSPENIVENDDFKILWNWEIQTDKTIQHNVPDLTLVNKKENVTYLIDIAIPLAANIDKKQNEKITKYLPLAEELKRVWKQNQVHVVPIIVGATGEIPRKLHDSLKQLNIKASTYLLLQKSVILDTCRIVRKVMGEANDHNI